MSVDHYENFPVASLLCPPRLRPAIVAIYRFARTADDIADEGDASPTERLADLAAFRGDLRAVDTGGAVTARWPRVFEPLRAVIQKHALPTSLLADLLSAFEQDVVKQHYLDRAELLDYCRRSANPIGRLLLHLYGVTDTAALQRSDAICTALQLANFWQDLRTDAERGRVYLPETDCAVHGVAPQRVLQREDSPALRALVAEMVTWARTLMLDGASLVHVVPGRAGWELRLVVQGGLRILEKIERLGFATMRTRPTLVRADALLLLWRAMQMRAPAAPTSRAAA